MVATVTKESLFRGNKEKSIKDIADAGLRNTKHNTSPTFQMLPLDDNLKSLETQRETNTNWVKQRLQDCGGLDMFAFGAISVALTPEGEYLIYDGLGRYNLAEHTGLTEVPCLVTKMSAKLASYYFAYNQSRGRRNMTPEALYVNNYVAGDDDSIELAIIMERTGLYIQGNTEYPVPHPKELDAVEVKFRTINDAVNVIVPKGTTPASFEFMIDTIKLTTQTLKETFNEKLLQQDLFWATLVCVQRLLKTKDETNFNRLKDYLQLQSNSHSQRAFVQQWKISNKGTTGNAGKAGALAEEMLTHWKTTKVAPKKFKLRPSLNELLAGQK